MLIRLSLIILTFTLFSCQSKKPVDLLLFNGNIQSHGPQAFQAECLVLKDGKVLAYGSFDSLSNLYQPQETIDLKGMSVYPAWHDAHAHFASYGRGLSGVNLKGLSSWEDCLNQIQKYIESKPERKWIVGRGWDQNLWGGAFPDNRLLDSLFPNHFFYLSRVDGHAALVSSNVLELAGYSTQTQIPGGELIQLEGDLSGILIDAAADRIREWMPEPGMEEWREALLAAQEECLNHGLAAITEAGLPLQIIQLIDSMHKEGSLHIKFITMLNPGKEEFEFAKQGIYETPMLKVGSFKLYADGALGSRGAKLKAPYCDHSGTGLLIEQPEFFDSICRVIYDLGFQANTHCIGDSANRLILETYGRHLKGKNDRRWRIEHAQIVETSDRPFFQAFSIVPSVQPTHATSDMPWAESRLCSHRMSGAYAYKSLLNTSGVLPLGTDFPVEEVNPLLTYLSAVYRQNKALQPSEGFQKEEALTPNETIKGMTWWPAWAGFKENVWGALEPGMDADFVVYEKPLETVNPEEILNMKPQSLYINGIRRR